MWRIAILIRQGWANGKIVLDITVWKPLLLVDVMVHENTESF